MKLTRLIENFGAIMVKSTERMEDYINTLDTRISAIEQSLGISAQRINIGGAAPSLTMAAAPVATASGAPNLSAAPAATASGAPNLSAAPSGAPNLSAAPSGAPNLSAAPNLSGGGDIPAPASQGTTGSGISSADLMKAAANLQKAPERPPSEEPGEPGMGPAPSLNPFGGPSAAALQDIKAGLKKVDQDEHRKERAAAAAGGSMPASMALNMEVKEALEKRKSQSEDEDDVEFEPTQVAPASPQKSTKQMKEALQGELRDAFSSLLESDTQDDEE